MGVMIPLIGGLHNLINNILRMSVIQTGMKSSIMQVNYLGLVPNYQFRTKNINMKYFIDLKYL